MRELKFRVWDNRHEIMMKLSEVNTYSTIDIISNVFKDSLNVMQYTGLKDKNDVEIYEGDIVQVLGGEEYNGYREYSVIGEIRWQGCGFDLVKDGCGYNIRQVEYDTIEVIENIYETSNNRYKELI